MSNDFKIFAGGGSANVLTQLDYEALLATLIALGFPIGKVYSEQANKVWRQNSIMATMVAQFIEDLSGENSVDDGTITTLLANFITSVENSIGSGSGTLLSYQEFIYGTYFDLNTSSWVDVTGFTDDLIITDQPVLADISVQGSTFMNDCARPSYMRLVINGGEYSNEIIDYTATEGIDSVSVTMSFQLSAKIPLINNTTYTIKVQARNSTSAPTQNCRFNASQDHTSSADPDARNALRILTYKQ